MTRPYTMPFGKYKGTPLAEIPDDYLAPDLRDSARLILDFGEAEFMRRHARDASKVAVGQRAARALMAFVAPGGGR